MIRKLRKAEAFTLVELLVVVVIIGILAAIALPNFIGAQTKAKEASVRGNMRTAQVASEGFAVDNGGVYGADAAAIAPYLPGGSNSIGGTAGQNPVNPFTNVQQAIQAGAVANVQATRQAAPGAQPGGAGTTAYNQVTLNGVNGASYAVTGGGADTKMLRGSQPNTTLVLSNQ